MAIVTLNPGKERPVIQRHPWVFSGAIGTVKGYVGRGDSIDVCTADGRWLARGTWSSGSQIRVRLCTWEQGEELDDAFWRGRIERAVASRAALGYDAATPCRLVYAESDGLPGVIADRYGPFIVLQLLTQGAAARAQLIAQTLAELTGARGVYERSDADVRQKEDLPPAEGPLWGDVPDEPVALSFADGTRMLADLRGGQKTGTYLDQARNRQIVAGYAAGREMLDCFCYSGGFTIAAARAGAAQITAVDSSGPALETLSANLGHSGVATPVEIVEADVFRQLREYRLAGRQFDLIVLDPPKFAQSNSQIERATRGYKDINLIAMQILRPGGILATFSCSGLVSLDLFQKVVAGAAMDAKRDVQVVERLGHAPDHPLLLTFPEGEYLKGFVCRVQ